MNRKSFLDSPTACGGFRHPIDSVALLSLRHYAEKYHVSTQTARSHLKRIFEKTNTHRQGRLLRLIFAFVHR